MLGMERDEKKPSMRGLLRKSSTIHDILQLILSDRFLASGFTCREHYKTIAKS